HHDSTLDTYPLATSARTDTRRWPVAQSAVSGGRPAPLPPSTAQPSVHAGPFLHLFLLIDHIRLGRHDEIIAVQSVNRMRPPAHSHVPPLGQNRRVVQLRLSQRPHHIRESERLGEGRNIEIALQARRTIAGDDMPIWHRAMELEQILAHQRRLTS